MLLSGFSRFVVLFVGTMLTQRTFGFVSSKVRAVQVYQPLPKGVQGSMGIIDAEVVSDIARLKSDIIREAGVSPHHLLSSSFFTVLLLHIMCMSFIPYHSYQCVESLLQWETQRK